MNSKAGFESSLLTQVVEARKCFSCGSCVINCPNGGLKIVNGRPTLVKECKVCGVCAQACPRYNWSLDEAEKFVFSRVRNPQEAFGVYRRIIVAQAKKSDIRSAGQEGGAATAMLVAALQNGLIDGAVVATSKQEKPFFPLPTVATTTQSIIGAAGTKYFFSSTILALSEVVKQGKTQIALVGTPCQILAVRKMQLNNLKKYVAPVKYLIGLMCSECFDYEGLMAHIKAKLGVNLSEIVKINIKGKMLVTTPAGTTAIPLAEVKQYVRGNCRFCQDFSSELADVSVGGLDLEGWTFVITRTEKGEELVSNAEKAGLLETKPLEDEFAMGLLLKLTKKKHDNVAAVALAK